MTKEELGKFLDSLVEQVRIRTRYDKFNELVGDIVEKPIRDEIVAAIYDALGEINSYEPSTNFTMESIAEMSDTRWHKVLMLGASKNFILTLVFDWTANGFGPQIEDLQIENKLPDYKDLQTTLNDQFIDLIEKLKLSAIKLIRTSSFATTKNSRLSSCKGYSSTMTSRYSKSYNTGRIKG